MEKFVCKIKDPAGLHARPTSIIVSVASKFDSDVKIKANGLDANMKSIINVMALGVKQGDEITIEVDGDDAKETIIELKKALKENNLI